MTRAWIGWRSLCIPDQEGNVVEFSCHDPTVLEAAASSRLAAADASR